ncbi:rhodanese-like domain-containing protein [Rubellimicrobium aerolatum]|uniref:Rhodanese-like domain-containing protein n=1 Tax=Rubellimicrobium aerolatum TaxID=490979 RepID=A0ABW0SBS1_9RHOB|nr:rhodanese-like domain-containing protein [Rubellimicrobium aerolatum]MBP1805957.1 rhodanese-related sulfurtransferase [Rubellimicrobium aerolatum]
MSLSPIDSPAVLRLLDQGALLVDIREEDERAQAHVPGSLHAPLSELPRRIGGPGLPAVVFLCSCGDLSHENAARLQAVTSAPAYRLDGGLAAWRRAGLPVIEHRWPLLAIGRQVDLLWGTLALLGVALGAEVTPAFFALPALAGGSLVWTGLTGRCSVAAALRRMPWNRPSGLAAD